jgi:hypothetical protein
VVAAMTNDAFLRRCLGGAGPGGTWEPSARARLLYRLRQVAALTLALALALALLPSRSLCRFHSLSLALCPLG